MGLDLDDVRGELRRLRRGQALGRPQAGLDLSAALRRHLVGTAHAGADSALAVVDSLRRAIGGLSAADRRILEAEMNLDAVHSHPTLTDRQESVAAALGCTAKTVRRRADRALTALALIVASDTEPGNADQQRDPGDGAEAVRRFWCLNRASAVDVVCSEIPGDELPAYAVPGDRNYVRYAKFADLDTLMFVRSRLAQLAPRTVIRDFSPSEHHESDASAVIVIGGPPWNAKYREFLPQLPYHFEPHLLGEDDPLVVPMLRHPRIEPRWTGNGDLVDDVGIFTRLTVTSGTTVFLLGGCLTAGVLGAARTFLHGDVAPGNVNWVNDYAGEDDVVVVVEARRLGGMTDAADLTVRAPLVALRRPRGTETFEVVEDNMDRRR